MLAAELLKEPEVKRLEPQLRSMPAQKIAVVGHSFTMGLHWSSPSSFVPIVIDVFRRENPNVEFKQFAGWWFNCLARAEALLSEMSLPWKPDKVMLVVMTRTMKTTSLKQMGQRFRTAVSRLTCLTKFTIRQR